MSYGADPPQTQDVHLLKSIARVHGLNGIQTHLYYPVASPLVALVLHLGPISLRQVRHFPPVCGSYNISSCQEVHA